MCHDYEHMQNPNFPCLWTRDYGAAAQLDEPGGELNVSRTRVMLASSLTEVVTADIGKVFRTASPCHQPCCQHLWVRLTLLIPEIVVLKDGIITAPSVRPSLYALETNESRNKMPQVWTAWLRELQDYWNPAVGRNLLMLKTHVNFSTKEWENNIYLTACLGKARSQSPKSDFGVFCLYSGISWSASVQEGDLGKHSSSTTDLWHQKQALLLCRTFLPWATAGKSTWNIVNQKTSWQPSNVQDVVNSTLEDVREM